MTRPNRQDPRSVYFIRPIGLEGPVKIGTTVRLDWRLADLKASSPLKLELWAIIRGGHLLERRFHAFFADTHSHSEWFHWSNKMAATVESILDGTFDIDCLPCGVRVDYKPKHERPPPREMAPLTRRLALGERREILRATFSRPKQAQA